MKRKYLLFAFVTAVVLIVFCFYSAPVSARTAHFGGNGFVSHSYGFHGYRGYSRTFSTSRWHGGWASWGGVPRVGVIFPALPFGCTRIFIGGYPYYFYDGVYFSPCPVGYIVVPAPDVDDESSAVVPDNTSSQADTASGTTITINIPKSKGGYKSITLTKKDGGYIGPQGEFYPGHPTVSQLKALYGE